MDTLSSEKKVQISEEGVQQPVGNVFETYRSPSDHDTTLVHIHDEEFKNLRIDPTRILGSKNITKHSNHSEVFDWKYKVTFDVPSESHGGPFKNQVGLISCVDIAQILYVNHKDKRLCDCQGHKKQENCYNNRRALNKGNCPNVKQEDLDKLTKEERDCLEHCDVRIWQSRFIESMPQWECHISDYIEVENPVESPPTKKEFKVALKATFETENDLESLFMAVYKKIHNLKKADSVNAKDYVQCKCNMLGYLTENLVVTLDRLQKRPEVLQKVINELKK